MAGVQLGGLVSGMDTSSLISQLMEIERQPVYNKQQNIQEMKSGKKIWEEVDSKISSFESKISTLKLSSTFNSKNVEVSDETILNATAKTSAANQNYTLKNVVLAEPGKTTSSTALSLSDGVKANVSATSTIADGNQKFNEGTSVVEGSFKINGVGISVDEDDTVKTVINKINISTANVKATFDDTTGEFKLEQKTTGSSYDIEIDATDTSGFLTAVGLDGELGNTIDNGVNSDDKRYFSEINGAGQSLEGVTSGYFTINDYTFEIDEATDSISTVISKINNSEAGVTAFYDSDTKKVTLTSEEAGEDLVVENDTSGFLNAINVLGDSETEATYAGTNASFTLNGVDFTKESNSFEINGVNFELKSETEAGETINVSVKADTDKAYNSIKEFIDKYNEVVEFLASKTAKEAELQGDSMANNMIRRLRSNMTNMVEGVENKYSQLTLIGIESSSSGPTLSLDKNILKEALESDPSEIKKLFTNESGIGRINDETPTGTGVDYQLAEKPSNIDEMEITVGTVTYSTSSSTNKIITSGDPGAGEVYVNTVSGEIKFGTEPTEAITVDYDYVDEDYAGGIAPRMEEYLAPLTQYSGILDNQIDSIKDNIDDANDWIANFENRLALREEGLVSQFTAMEQAMSESNSQSQWLSSQLAGLQ